MPLPINIVDFAIFKEVEKSYGVQKTIDGKPYECLYTKKLLEESFKCRSEQLGVMDFIDIAFPNASGYFCFFQKGEKTKSHTFYNKKEVEAKLLSLLTNSWGKNTYISYSTYYKRQREYITVPKRIKFEDGSFAIETVKKLKPRRTQNNIVYTFLLAQDLDYYKLGITDEEAVKKIAKLVREEQIICPSFILFTGRGIQLIWAVQPFKNIKNYTHDKEWRSIQDEMIGIFNKAGLNPDTVVKNPSAVTRTVQTYNRAAKTAVKAFYLNAAYLTLDDFIFYHGLVPQPDKKISPKKTQKQAVIIPFPIQKVEEILEEVKREWKEHYHINDRILERMNWNLNTLNWARVQDIFTYVNLFKEKKAQMHAKRNWLAMVVAFHVLVATNGDSQKAYNKVVELWDALPDQNETTLEEILRRGYQYAVEKYNEWVTGTWDRKKYVFGGLFYNNKRLLELLGITKAYDVQLKLKTIKIRNKEYEAYKWRVQKYGEEEAENHTWEKEVERRKEKGREKTEDKLWQLEQAIKRHPEFNKTQLAEHLGISRNHLYRLLKQI